MTQENKELLLKDLCARLPYGVIVKLDDKFKFNKGDRVLVKELLDLYCIEGIKPYLRSMSSMTDEERKEFLSFDCPMNHDPVGMIDWLLRNYFDFRGLIPQGLALEAPEGMYNID